MSSVKYLVAQTIKNLPAMQQRYRFDPWVRKVVCRRKWLPSPVFLPGELLGQKSLVGCSPWGCKESDTAEQLALHLVKDISSAFFFFFPVELLSLNIFVLSLVSVVKSLEGPYVPLLVQSQWVLDSPFIFKGVYLKLFSRIAIKMFRVLKINR